MTTLFLIIFFGIAGLIGLWAFACLISALIKEGPIGLIKGYISALTGRSNKDKSSKNEKNGS